MALLRFPLSKSKPHPSPAARALLAKVDELDRTRPSAVMALDAVANQLLRRKTRRQAKAR